MTDSSTPETTHPANPSIDPTDVERVAKSLSEPQRRALRAAHSGDFGYQGSVKPSFYNDRHRAGDYVVSSATFASLRRKGLVEVANVRLVATDLGSAVHRHIRG